MDVDFYEDTQQRCILYLWLHLCLSL